MAKEAAEAQLAPAAQAAWTLAQEAEAVQAQRVQAVQGGPLQAMLRTCTGRKARVAPGAWTAAL